jgi:pimeloyl-ACP methyl ester carboxylesterase
MAFADSAGAHIYFDDGGTGEPVFLCLPGWCVHHTMFAPTVERLRRQHRVLTLDWRGHGNSPASERDFGYPDMLTDTLAVIGASGARSVIPIAQAHGGWVAVELRRRLGERVPALVFTSWNPFFTTGNPLAQPFLETMRALQDPAHWREATERLVGMWLTDAPHAVVTQMRAETGAHGYDDWARGGREITSTYAREGDPLRALSGFDPPVRTLHLYSQPRAPEYLAAQEAFAREHPWFTVCRLDAVSHFPTLELPDKTADVIGAFIQ